MFHNPARNRFRGTTDWTLGGIPLTGVHSGADARVWALAGSLRRSYRHAVMFAAALLATLLALPAADAERSYAPPPRKPAATPPRHGRDTKAIDDGWSFLEDPGNLGEAGGWAKSAPATAKPIGIPSFLPSGSSPGAKTAVWFFREIDPPGAWLGQTIRIRFSAVAEQAQVWLNGKYIGDHSGGATPFVFNVTKEVKVGAKNLLAVRVEGSPDHGVGIWQGVQMMAHDEAFIDDVFPYGGPLGNLRAEVELTNTSDKSGDASLDARVVVLGPPNSDIKSTGQVLSLTPKRNVTTMVVNVPKKRLVPWSLTTPTLYSLELVFHQDKDVLDTTETRFGFRDFGWKDGAITINGTAISPKTAGSDAVKPLILETDQAKSSMRDQLSKLKSTGVNVIYLDAPVPALLALTDEIGILVVVGPRRGQTAAIAQAELMDLLRRDRAHPSILAWNISDLGKGAARMVQALDPTRFIIQIAGAESKLTPPRSEDRMWAPIPAGLAPD